VSSNSIVTRRFGAALVTALVVVVPAFGCASDDEDSTTSEAAATAPPGTGTVDEGVDIEEAQAQLCSGLSDLEADLTEASGGTEAGADLRARLASFAVALEAGAQTLTSAGAADAATAAESLASDLESLSTASGEDAQARAGEAADGAQQLTDALECE
jgi:hypothetical protein